MEVLASCGNDVLIPHIVWNNLHPLLEDHSDDFVGEVARRDLGRAPNVAALLPRVVERLLGRNRFNARPIAALLQQLVEQTASSADAARGCLNVLATRVQTRELPGGTPPPPPHPNLTTP